MNLPLAEASLDYLDGECNRPRYFEALYVLSILPDLGPRFYSIDSDLFFLPIPWLDIHRIGIKGISVPLTSHRSNWSNPLGLKHRLLNNLARSI